MSKPEEKALSSADLPTEILKQMGEKSRKVLVHYIDKFGKIRFFSYGSNMNEKDFRTKMLNRAKELQKPLSYEEASLVNHNKCTLEFYKRSLKNDSLQNGAAYTIHSNRRRKLEGICHDISINALHPFLKKEGMLSENEPDSRKYEIFEKQVSEEKCPVLVIIGNKTVHLKRLHDDRLRQAHKYVKDICIPGAKEMKVDYRDMESTKGYLESIMLERGLQIDRTRKG